MFFAVCATFELWRQSISTTSRRLSRTHKPKQEIEFIIDSTKDCIHIIQIVTVNLSGQSTTTFSSTVLFHFATTLTNLVLASLVVVGLNN